MLDGRGDPRGKRRRERGNIPFQPAQGAGHDHFVKVKGVFGGGGDGDRGRSPALNVRFERSDLGTELELGFSQGAFGDELED